MNKTGSITVLLKNVTVIPDLSANLNDRAQTYRQKGMNQMGFDRRQRLSLDEHRKRFVLLGGHQVTEPGLFRQLGRRFRCKVHFLVGN